MNKQDIKELINLTLFIIPFLIVSVAIVVALFSTVEYGIYFLLH